ncbi:MAG TPA: tellurite resistance TerB family protein [Vicinamibacterales bacterium]
MTALRRKPARPRLSLDESLIALFIAAMEANGHTSPRELERAHHLIWSMRRFRGRDGDEVNAIIEEMRSLLETSDVDEVIDKAIASIPARFAPSAFSVLVDLLFADGRLDPEELVFLRRVGRQLGIPAPTQRRIVEVILVKNRL